MSVTLPNAAAHVPLAPLSTLGVGGAARWFLRARREDEIAGAHAWSQAAGVSIVVLGGGSNVVIADEGLDALVLQPALTGTSFTGPDETGDGLGPVVSAGAGEPWDPLVAAVVARGWSGIEALSGIPGLVGGTPIQNVGAYGQEVAGAIEHVRVFDRTSATFDTLSREACGFAYRTSRFKGVDAGRFVVCRAQFRLGTGPAASSYPDVLAWLAAQGVPTPGVADVRAAVLAVRRRKSMVLDPDDQNRHSVGSFFTNPVVSADAHARIVRHAGDRVPGFALGDGTVKVPAAWLIERAGFSRGYADGPVGLSTRHPLAIVNRGGGRARDIVRLARQIKTAVARRFDVWLRPEPVFLGFTGDPDVAFLEEAGDPCPHC